MHLGLGLLETFWCIRYHCGDIRSNADVSSRSLCMERSSFIDDKAYIIGGLPEGLHLWTDRSDFLSDFGENYF